MKNSIATCFYAEQLLDFQELSEFDLQVSEQYLPLIAQHYHSALLTSEYARDYLHEKYGIAEKEIASFSIGYSDRSLGNELPRPKSDEGDMLRGALARLKVYKGTGHEAFRGCITVPIFQNSEVVGFYAERVERPRRDARKYYWAPSQLPCVFNLDNVVGTDVVYLCQSPLIAIQMRAALSNNVIATDRMFNLQEADLAHMASMGIQTVVAIGSELVHKHLLRQLGKRLAKFGMNYQRLDKVQELRYGTA